MKKTDEMDRNIQLRAEERGYKTVLLALGVWTLFNCWQTLGKGAPYHPLPGLILCFSVCVQSFSQLALKQRMTAGDEEYREPNKLFWTIVISLLVAVAILGVGTYFMIRA
ncbi:MAG: hypothetical protein HFI29_01795 [Lachnospiraceae bacterium]|jgi:hypothetical protein|nr:hypothetical protein [Lachnospiraceae bacterium]